MSAKYQNQITDMHDSGLQKHSVVSRKEDGVGELVNDLVAEEVAVAFVYNGITHAVMMASPIDLEDFALGFSLTEGIIDIKEDLKGIEIQRAPQGIALQLKIKALLANRLKERQRSLSGRAGCGICGLTDLAAAMPKLAPLTPQTAPNHQAIDRAAAALEQQQTLQQACGGVHGAALCNEDGELLVVREDVGRHNALDKLLGAAISSPQGQAVSTSDFILVSSRSSHELVNKTVIAGINSLVSLSAATSLAIEVASKANLNLIGFVRGKRQLVYFQNS